MPEVAYGVKLVPPQRDGDCACTFCGLFRAHHYWRRAVLASLTATFLVMAPFYVHQEMSKTSAAGEVVAAVGGLMIVATGAVVLALGSWQQPIRRLLHMLRPRVGEPTRD